MEDRPQYWFGAKIGFFRYRPPQGWRGWLVVAVWMSVWLAAIPFMNSADHPLSSLGFFIFWLAVLIGLERWKGEP
jgi:hypothetical protein